MRRATALLLTITLALAACSQPPPSSWTADVLGVTITYRVTDTPLGPASHTTHDACSATLPTTPSHQPLTAAHQLAHCLDQQLLGSSHNGFTTEGCAWGQQFCDPAEGFAQTYAIAYHFQCQDARAPLGLQPSDGVDCTPPDPRQIKPDMVVPF